MAKNKRSLSQEFVVSDNEGNSSDEDRKPKKAAKKAPAKKPKKEASSDDDDEEEETPLAGASGRMAKNAEGDAYLELSNNRRVTVRSFKKNILVDIRETYSKDGKDGLPGKKGIALTLDQWKALVASIDVIDAAVQAL